ncbi:MAG: DUF3024 domain-containing protein [Chitinophagales bacterium]|nr:DUF3024 domain-containing protein [Chitinophagales bacterium]
MNWHSYEHKPTVKRVNEFCKLVEEDKQHWFFG